MTEFTKIGHARRNAFFFPPSLFFPLVPNAFRQGMHGVGCLWRFEIVSVKPLLDKTGENSN